VLLRDGEACQYCGCRPGRAELTLDHILPGRRVGRRAGRTSSPPAGTATPARPIAPPSRPGWPCARRRAPWPCPWRVSSTWQPG
jgi:hypothetical protein